MVKWYHRDLQNRCSGFESWRACNLASDDILLFMDIETFAQKYTLGNKIGTRGVFTEIKEFFIEILKLNKKGIKEEYQDVLIFIQLWLYCQFGINGRLWSSGKDSINKFIERKNVWQKIYKYVGLDRNVSNYCGNYNKTEKVISHLSGF